MLVRLLPSNLALLMLTFLFVRYCGNTGGPASSYKYITNLVWDVRFFKDLVVGLVEKLKLRFACICLCG